MFFEGERILAMREMICAAGESGRRAALAKILPMQRGDFIELFEIMAGLPVTIRLLDPPLHEFLPRQEHEIEAVAAGLKMPLDRIKARILELTEFNPMLGLRGSRLAIRYPEITEMQARAIFEAAIEVEKKTGRARAPGNHDPARGLPPRVRHPGRRDPRHGENSRCRNGRQARL